MYKGDDIKNKNTSAPGVEEKILCASHPAHLRDQPRIHGEPFRSLRRSEMGGGAHRRNRFGLTEVFAILVSEGGADLPGIFIRWYRPSFSFFLKTARRPEKKSLSRRTSVLPAQKKTKPYNDRFARHDVPT